MLDLDRRAAGMTGGASGFGLGLMVTYTGVDVSRGCTHGRDGKFMSLQQGVAVPLRRPVARGCCAGEAIRNALTTIDDNGVAGELKLDKNNQASPLFYITRWGKDGTRTISMPTALAAACGS
ncbi:hypothetical protein [Chelatococcus asaccharovorans]|uniref:hypothetical protein n=1 Tax=Chelatococcus asaccharovorans TaxID=28210 RepID=UPI00224C6FC3|nr:hypothetical protein [Chelatococcus asaccharovorans]CAH1659260.1 conserved hypothetical protein [Chelatococcus asaccharovorans]CAH1688062.1 conserved hypothetical protein [Chelatococcus asaccharovorans]